MAMVEEGQTHPRGEALLEELRWVHGIIRENLAAIRALAGEVAGGAPVARVQAALDELAATNIVWTLRTGCLRYCTLVHHHHRLEDRAFFPGLRRIDPALRPVIDKLEADHVAVAAHLDRVEAAAGRLPADATARADLTAALAGLADLLLTHLDYEEENLGPTLRRLTRLPYG